MRNDAGLNISKYKVLKNGRQICSFAHLSSAKSFIPHNKGDDKWIITSEGRKVWPKE